MSGRFETTEQKLEWQRAYLKDVVDRGKNLTHYEKGFVRTATSQLGAGRPLSVNQAELLKKIRLDRVPPTPPTNPTR